VGKAENALCRHPDQADRYFRSLSTRRAAHHPGSKADPDAQPVVACFLFWAVVWVQRLVVWSDTRPSAHSAGQDAVAAQGPMGGGLLDGIHLVLSSPYLLGICMLMLLFTTLATFLYFQQTQIVGEHFAAAGQRTAVFAAIDLAVNSLTILIQVFFTGRLVKWLGLAWTLTLIPLLLGVGFAALGFAPVLAVLFVVQVIRRAGNYAIMRPAREMLYVVLGKQEKYKAKNFIDTVVYRGGDVVGAWLYAALRGLGMGLGEIAWLAVPLAGLWGWLGHALGRRQSALAEMRRRDT